MPPPRTLTPTPAPTLLAPTLGPALLAPAPSPTRVALALTRWAGVARKGASPTLRPLPLKPLILSLSRPGGMRAQPSPQPSRRVRQLEPQQLVPRAAPEPSQTEPRTFNTAPGRRVRRVGKSGVKLVRVKIGVCRHFLQPGRGAAGGAPSAALEPYKPSLAPSTRPLGAESGEKWGKVVRLE